MEERIQIVSDPKAIKIGIEETRRTILSYLKIRPMAVSEIAEAIGKDQSTIYRHIEKLLDSNYVQVHGERKVHHIPEKIYSRTASIFLLSPEKDIEKESLMIQMYTQERARHLSEAISSLDPQKDVDSEALKKQLIDEFSEKFENPYVAASHGTVDNVIDPAETRPMLIKALDMLENKRVKQLPRKHGNINL